jgi:DNA-binding transcriptional MerR regulator
MIDKPKTVLPSIPAKRYFTIGEVSDLCMVKPHVLRYWEQEFTQLRPMKRRGNRRYYQHHEVLLVRRIRDLLYEQGFTISGARNQLGDRIADVDPDAGHLGADVPMRRLRERHDDEQVLFADLEGSQSASAQANASGANTSNANASTLNALTSNTEVPEELVLENLPLDVPQAREFLRQALRFLS